MAWISRAVMAVVLLGAVGCDSGATTTEGGAAGAAGAGGTGDEVCPGDPAEGPVSPECGVWVSTSLGDDKNEGTQAAPVASLTRAVELAAEGTGHIYACGETWTEGLIVPSGVSLHGGFDCEDGWEYVGEDKRAMLASDSPFAMKWIKSASLKQAYFTDFYVESANATEPGGSSVGVFITADFPLKVTRCEIVAGDGAAGANGANGGDFGVPAPAGANGADGGNACSAPVSKGGAAPETVCDNGMSKGGAGGDAAPGFAKDGDPGAPGGPGGLGEQSAPSCTGGSPGALGVDGVDGLGGNGGLGGLMTPDGLFGYPGKDGTPGKPGQGGGGGGATYGNTATCGLTNPGGAAGGSGGAGGCGGNAGRGGQPGGHSIGLASLGFYGIELSYVVLRGGYGGDGGEGGLPQEGGIGGSGGKGGFGAGTIAPGCSGGNGGKGGKGGYGGGASGGSAGGAAAPWNNLGFQQTMIQSYPGVAGLGGFGGPGMDGRAQDGVDNGIVSMWIE